MAQHVFGEGVAVGTSLYEPEMLATAREIMDGAAALGCENYLPKDVVVAPEMKPTRRSALCRRGVLRMDVYFCSWPREVEEIKGRPPCLPNVV
jgi:3-phosphoglycerate kinase